MFIFEKLDPKSANIDETVTFFCREYQNIFQFTLMLGFKDFTF